MPVYFWIDFIFLIVSLILSLSLLLIVYGTAPNRRENQIFTLFAIIEVCWNVAAVLLRLSLLKQNNIIFITIPLNPEMWFRLTAICLGILCLMSLVLTAVLLNKRLRWIKPVLLIGILILIFVNTFHSTEYIRNVRLNQLGLVTDDVLPYGWILILIITSYMAAAIILFWKNRHEFSLRFFGVGLFIIYLGIIFGGALNFVFPSMSVFNAAGLALMAYAIIRLQILNPLRQLNMQLEALITEKEILIKEVHHRVKNNLQLVISLLNIESGKSRNKETIKILQSSQNRIHSIASVHDELYQSEHFTHVDFKSYISKLTSYLDKSYQPADRSVQFQIRADNIQFPIHIAVPCGLIMNELITNAMKHAFPPSLNRLPFIAIDIEESNNKQITMQIEDNGRGFSKPVQISESGTFGLYAIKILVENQLDGQIDIDSTSKGTRIKITFNIDEPKKKKPPER
jgi:two-component sensor histidine kinase